MTDRAHPTGAGDGTVDQDTGLPGVFELAQQLRVDAIRCSTAAGSGHPTSGMSAADVMAVLMARHLTYDWDRPSRALARVPVQALLRVLI